MTDESNIDIDIDSLLDVSLDDIDDLPEFGSYPLGAHKVLATFEQKDINGSPAVELGFKYISCESLTNSKDVEPKEGDMASVLFMLNNEVGLGKLKAMAIPMGVSLGLEKPSIRDIIEAVTDVECLIITSFRKNKNDPDSPYMNVKELAVI